VNVPSVVVNCTAVPLGTGWPFSLTVAVMVEVELTSGEALVTVSVTLAPTGGVGWVLVVGGVVVGDVGDSPLHAAKSVSDINTANRTFRCFTSIISTPVIPLVHPSAV
jgi:hypothetical protein